MTCRAWEDLLQQHLDGGDPSPLRHHLRDCPDCVAHRSAVSRLLAGLGQLTPATPPPGLTDRLMPGLLAEARSRKAARFRRRVAVVAVAAVAASVLAAVVLTWKPADKPAKNAPLVAANDDPPPPLRDSMARAGDAVASMTNNAAKDTGKDSAALLAAVKESAEPLTRTPVPNEPDLDRPMREAADGVKGGLSPVTASARRAVGLFLRDLPVGKADKPAEAAP